MFKSVLLATDGSDHAAKATRTAIDIAAKYGAKLTVVTVLNMSLSLAQVEHMPQAKKFPQEVKDDIKHFQNAVASDGRPSRPTILVVPAPYSAIMALGNQILDDAAEAAKSAGVADIERLTLQGHPAEEIAGAVKKAGADLIVMGTRGLSDLKGIVVGSVSHKVMHLAECPCLTVK